MTGNGWVAAMPIDPPPCKLGRIAERGRQSADWSISALICYTDVENFVGKMYILPSNHMKKEVPAEVASVLPVKNINSLRNTCCHRPLVYPLIVLRIGANGRD